MVIVFFFHREMFAHLLLLATVVFAMVAIVWQNMPYNSLISDKVLYAYDYIIGMIHAQIIFIFLVCKFVLVLKMAQHQSGLEIII